MLPQPVLSSTVTVVVPDNKENLKPFRNQTLKLKKKSSESSYVAQICLSFASILAHLRIV